MTRGVCSVIAMAASAYALLVLPAGGQEAETKGAVRGILVPGPDRKAVVGVEISLLKVPFRAEDLKDERKRREVSRKMFFLPQSAETETDRQGRFRFEDVAAGNYFLSAAYNDTHVHPGQDFLWSEGERLMITIEPGKETHELEIQAGKTLEVLSIRISPAGSRED